VTSPIVTSANVNLGTLPGVYGDSGIFYSTAPETAFGTYSGGKITNNSGDEVGLRTLLGTTLNKWDAWQMAGYGIAGTTNPAYPLRPWWTATSAATRRGAWPTSSPGRRAATPGSSIRQIHDLRSHADHDPAGQLY